MFVLVLSELDLPGIKSRSEWKEAGPLTPPTSVCRLPEALVLARVDASLLPLFLSPLKIEV